MRFRLLVVVLLLAGACREAPAPDHPPAAPFTDALGREVAVPRPALRVVTLAPNLTEMVYAAGAGARLVGVTTADDFPPAVDTLARFSALPLNIEAVVLLRPDLALASTQVNAPRDGDALAAVGVPAAFLPAASLDDVVGGIRTIGTLLGTAPAADRAADRLRDRIDRLRARTAPGERPRVLFLIDDERLFSFGRGSYIHDLVALAGGESVTAELPNAAPVLSEEFVLSARPDVIVGTFGDDYDPARLRTFHPTWSDLPAVRDGHVYALPADLFLRPGPRLVDGAELLAQLLGGL